jgi:hypothetical protein
VTQVERKTGRPYTNFVADIVMLDQASESEELDWDWISARRDPAMTDLDCLTCAPLSWPTWVYDGASAHPRLRRIVARHSIIRTAEKFLTPGSREEQILRIIMELDSERKPQFGALAESVAAQVLAGDRSGTTRFVGSPVVAMTTEPTSLAVSMLTASSLQPRSLFSAKRNVKPARPTGATSLAWSLGCSADGLPRDNHLLFATRATGDR